MPKDISNPEKGSKITLYQGKELYPTITVLRPNQGDVPEYPAPRPTSGALDFLGKVSKRAQTARIR